MGILEELEPKRSLVKEIENYLDSLDEKERAEWDAVMADTEKYTGGPIVAALRRRGVNVNLNAVYRYRLKMEAKNGK